VARPPQHHRRVIIPKGVIVYAVQQGWHANLPMARGVVTMISWTGGHLYPHEFDDFVFLAATPKTTGVVQRDAFQRSASKI
jgi:hypothetical protein